jgi:MarR family transcriptional repressor of emrRAB
VVVPVDCRNRAGEAAMMPSVGLLFSYDIISFATFHGHGMTAQSRLDRLMAGRPPALAETVAATRMVFRVAHLLERRIDAALAPLGIEMREYLALILIADDAVEPLRPSDLGTTLDATPTQVTRLLDGLERKGLAQRTPSTQDRRSLQLALAPAARALLKRAVPVVHAAYEACWREVAAPERARTLKTLRRLHATLAPGVTP